jgi:hypothetical protein
MPGLREPSPESYRNVANIRDGISAFVEDRNLVILVDGSIKLTQGRSGRSFSPPTGMGRRTEPRMSECPDPAPSLLLIEFFGLRQLECLVAFAELYLSDLVVVGINAWGLGLLRNLDSPPLHGRDNFAILHNIEFLLRVIGRDLVGPRLQLRASDR